jgi:uncharacterized membrane protein YdjX (TVP38/TMEM64 family)
VSQSRHTLLRVAGGVAILVLVAVLMRILPVAVWIEQFKTWVQGAGPIGYVLYALAYVVCCVLFIPAIALTLGAGAIFGFVKGAAIVIVGATLGATAAFLLARTVMRHRIEAMTANNAKFRALDRAITGEGTKIMWLVRLSGFPPFTWVNYAFGLTGVSLSRYILITFFGIIPGTLAFTYAGAAGAEALTGSGNRIVLIATAIAAILVSVFIARIALNAIKRAGVETGVDESTG